VIAILVGLVNVCTANNTVAILTTGKLARDIGEKYEIDARRRASILDTASCIVQCMIPYGAQMLLASSLAGLHPDNIMGYLYYPWILTCTLALSIIFKPKKR
jgi:Na+/H+ antiporter NhaC